MNFFLPVVSRHRHGLGGRGPVPHCDDPDEPL